MLWRSVWRRPRGSVGGFGGPLFQVRLRNIDHALRFDERVGFLGRRKNELVVELDSVQAGNRDRIALPLPVWESHSRQAPIRNKVLPSLRRLGGCRGRPPSSCSRSPATRGWRTRSASCSSGWPATPTAAYSRRTTSRCRTTSPMWPGLRQPQHHRLHDGLRHHRHRAGLLTGQVQEAGRRRVDADREPDHSAGVAQARLHRRDDRGDRGVHRRARACDRRPGLRPEHYEVFDSAMGSGRSSRWVTSG